MRTSVRRVVLLATTALGVLALGATAWACTNLATLNLSSPAGQAGDTLTVTGSAFRVPSEGAPDPVVLTWNGVDGPVLATVTPDSAGNISATFSVPQGEPGYYVLVASQTDADGIDAYGTPARAAFEILGPGGESVVQPVSPSPAGLAADPSSTGMIALTALLGVLGLGLFGAGFAAFVRQVRGRDVPATAPVRRD